MVIFLVVILIFLVDLREIFLLDFIFLDFDVEIVDCFVLNY